MRPLMLKLKIFLFCPFVLSIHFNIYTHTTYDISNKYIYILSPIGVFSVGYSL